MKLVKCVVLLLVLCMAVSSFAANQEVKVDVLMSKITTLLKANKAADALPYMAELEGMEPSLTKPLPENFHFFYIDTLDKARDYTKAIERANIYLEKYGKKGKHYGQVVEILSRLEVQAKRRAPYCKIAEVYHDEFDKTNKKYGCDASPVSDKCTQNVLDLLEETLKNMEKYITLCHADNPPEFTFP